MSKAAVEWAESEVRRLREVAQQAASSEERDQYPSSLNRRVQTTQGLEFLRRVAPGSTFVEHAEYAVNDQYHESAAIEGVASALESWLGFVAAGLVTQLPYAAQARIDAATDLMEQVQTLLDDPTVIPAAPVMLAGAALEEFLRSLLATTIEAITGTPSMVKYAAALRKANVLTANDEKDVLAIAGARNDAAHGHFDRISPERARVMADQVNLFMRQKLPGG